MCNELSEFMESSGCRWLCSGNDPIVRNSLLTAFSEHNRIAGIKEIVIAPEDALYTDVSGFDPQRTNIVIPSADTGYFPGRDNGEINPDMLYELIEAYASDAEKTEILSYLDMVVEMAEIADTVLNRKTLIKALRASFLQELADEAYGNGRMDEEDYRDFLIDAGKDDLGRRRFKAFMNMMNRWFGFNNRNTVCLASSQANERLNVVVRADMRKTEREMLFSLLSMDIIQTQRQEPVCLILIESMDHKYSEEAVQLLSRANPNLRILFITRDFFGGHEKSWTEKMKTHFDSFVYSAHTDMNACERISESFGELSVVRTTRSVDYDLRFRNRTLIDTIFDTNKTERYAENAPVYEPLYRKEEIHRLAQGICLIQTPAYSGLLDLR